MNQPSLRVLGAAAPRWQFAALALSLVAIGCGSDLPESVAEAAPGEQADELMTDEPNQRILGYTGVAQLVLPPGDDDATKWCPGWLMNERVFVTAAHCLEGMEGDSQTGFRLDYMRPGVGRDMIHSPDDPVDIHGSSFYGGGSDFGDFISNPLNPSENGAKHDIGFVVTHGRWSNTTYQDYLRVYNDRLDTLTSVYVYGTGSIFRTSYTTDYQDRLRFSHFQVESPAFGSDLVISTTAGQTERLCSGDSGGPYIKKIDGLSLVAGVHHGTDRAHEDSCPKPGGDQWGEKLTWDGPNDFDWLKTNTGTTCTNYTPTGAGNNYSRCFSLPFINDAPEREQEHGGKLLAIAQLVGGVF